MKRILRLRVTEYLIRVCFGHSLRTFSSNHLHFSDVKKRMKESVLRDHANVFCFHLQIFHATAQDSVKILFYI